MKRAKYERLTLTTAERLCLSRHYWPVLLVMAIVANALFIIALVRQP